MGLDSVELLQKIEDRFSIAVSNSEAERLVTVQDLYDVVARHLHSTPEQMQAIQAEINRIIADHAGLDVSAIEPHKSITSDLGLD